MYRSLTRPSLALAALLVLPAPAATAEGPASFLETLDVRLVNLEVYVADRSGRPVEGLTARDFTLLEDGKRVELSAFSWVAAPGTTADAAAELAAPARIVLFFDNFAIQPQGRALILEGLEPLFADELPADALWAVASYDGYLRIHQGFTRDREALAAAIAESGRLSPLGVLRRAERDAVVRQGIETLRTIREMALDDQRRSLAMRRLRGYGQQIEAQAENERLVARAGVFALSHLVNGLGALPGRKAVVYLGEGIPMRAGEELYAAVEQLSGALSSELQRLDLTGPEAAEAQETDLDMRSSALDIVEQSGREWGSSRDRQATSGLDELAALANSGRVSFYALKTDLGEGGLAAEYAGEMRELLTPRLQGLRERNLADSLREMAAETGGRFALGTGVGELVEAARSDLGGYYFLGYEPRRPADGAYHRLEVKVKGRGLELRHRTGFVDKPPIARIADRTTAAMLLGIDDDPLGLKVRLGPPTPGPQQGLWAVPVDVTVQLGFLAGMPTGGKVPAALYVAARDPEGRTAPVQQLPLELDAGSEAHTTRFKLLMRGGDQQLGIGLVVPAAGAAAFVGRSLVVGPEEAAAGTP